MVDDRNYSADRLSISVDTARMQLISPPPEEMLRKLVYTSPLFWVRGTDHVPYFDLVETQCAVYAFFTGKYWRVSCQSFYKAHNYCSKEEKNSVCTHGFVLEGCVPGELPPTIYGRDSKS